MADKVNKEESVARVYQFLNKDKNWKAAADKNGDGTIIKTEFRAYLQSSGFKFNSGEDKEDLIDAFWKTVDSNTGGKVSGGSGISNKNALDAKEIKNVENTITVTKVIIAFMQDKEAPSGIEEQYRVAWKNSVKQGLIYRAAEFMKTGTPEGITNEWLNEAFRLSSAKATADYTAAGEIKSKLGNVDGYAVGDDKTLKNIVDEYVSQLEENPKDDNTIINEVKRIVAAYVDTAITNSSSSTSLLAKYGYDPSDNLNDLQFAVLTNDITDKIVEYIKTNNPEIYTDETKSQIEAVAKEFVKEYIKDKNATEFNSLKNFDVSIFTSSDTYSTLVNEIKTAQEAVKAARTKLDSYIAEVLALNDEEKNAVVLEVIGSTDAKEIMNKLLALKTVEEIETKYNELKTRIDAIDKARADAKAAELEAANKPFNFGDAKYTTHTSPNGDRFTPLTTMTLSDMSTKNTVIDLMEVDDMQHCNFESALSTSITNLNKFVTAITKSLSSSYNQSALSKAASKVLSLYTKAIQASKPHATITRHSEADTWTERFEFEGEAYEYQAASYYYNHNAVNTQYSSGCSASNNQLGLRVCYEHDDVEYKILVNSKCVIDLFQKFYKEALSA